MSYRSGNRRNFSGGNYGGGGNMGRSMNPWEGQNSGSGNYGNMRNQGGGGGQGGMNAEALNLANSLINNLLRNQTPPSLLDLPRGAGGGIGIRGPRQQLGNRLGGGGGNRNNNRRGQGGGFARGQKSGTNTNNKQGGGVRKQNAFDRAKKLLAKNSNKNKKDSTSGDKNDKKKTESVKESIYANVPNDMFYCHLCKKHMWDSSSFENHIKGRTHMMMREGIEESYRLKANMIRQEAKIAEQLKLIELDRLKRIGKSKAGHPREYCTMCDLNFHGHLSAHRKSEGHLALKKFLHPKCIECAKEFPTRIEFDTHLLMPDHLIKAAERNTKVGERKKNTLNILTEEDELKDVKQLTKKTKAEIKKGGEDGAAANEEKKENGDAGEDEKKDDTKMEEDKDGGEGAEEDGKDEEDVNQSVVEDPENCIIDYNEGDEIPTDVENKIPKYNCQRPVGAGSISKLECYECNLCGKFFDTEKTAEIHTRTVFHHRQFIRFINEKSSDTKIAQKRAAAALEENERKKRRLEESTAESKDGEKNATEEGGEENGQKEGELYDPSEATGDDDAEMNEAGDEDEEIKEEDEEINEEEEQESDANVANGVAKAENAEDVVEGDADPMETEEEKKPEPVEVETKPAPQTPKAATPTTPTTATTPQQKATANQPQAKATPARAANSQTATRGTPRARGRGRYNRY